MPRKVKAKHPILSMVPVKIEAPEEQRVYQKSTENCPCVVAEFSLERIAASVKHAEGGRHHHHLASHADKAMNLQHRWESLPIYQEGDYFPKKQLYTNFKRVLQDVFEK